jgi:hypothetical protein
MKITREQVASLDHVLDKPQDLQKIGAAVIHIMKQQLKPGVDIDHITLPVIDSHLHSVGGPVEDSISVGVNDVVSVSWSKDIEPPDRQGINERISKLGAREQAEAIKALVPKGLEAGRRVKLVR